MALFVVIAAFGVWRDVSPGLTLVGTLAALAAWDVDHFFRRTQAMTRIDGEAQLIRSHRQRLTIVAGLGLLLGGVAMGAQTAINFGWANVLGLIAIAGRSQVIGFFRHESD